MTLDTNEAEVMTVEEAAKILRIGRNAAYTLARRYIATDGREGLPVLVLGRTLRVPASALRAMVRLPLPTQ
ncbi:helix-turn-helix domain-containing protein [Aquihabitans sp. G128]|nr:helix-turn-helix domain-containing protein [Aquihabitans sp. G128]